MAERRFLTSTLERGLEGVVVKRVNSPYKTGARNRAWGKHKHRREAFDRLGARPYGESRLR